MADLDSLIERLEGGTMSEVDNGTYYVGEDRWIGPDVAAAART